MVSSHLLDEIDKMASVLGILSAGRLVFQGTRAELFARSLPDLFVSTPQAREALALGLPGRAVAGGIMVPGLDQGGAARMIEALVRHGITLYEVRRADQSLEDVFMALTGGAGALGWWRWHAGYCSYASKRRRCAASTRFPSSSSRSSRWSRCRA